MVRLACQRALSGRPGVRLAHRGLTSEALEAFVEAFYLPSYRGRVAFVDVLRKLKDLVSAFNKSPSLWERFKKAIGIGGLTDLPGVLKDLAKKGYSALKGAIGKAFSVLPLKLLTLPEAKLFSLNSLLERLVKKFPKFHSFLATKVKPGIDWIEKQFRKHLPTLGVPILVGVYCWIWWNVAEFEWDLHGLIDIVTGSITFSDLLMSFPSAILGAVIGALLPGLGTFSLFPMAFIARLAFLVGTRYFEWTGHGVQLNRAALQEDFGIPLADVPEAV